MDVQVVQHEMPLRRFGIAGKQTAEMGQGILLGLCWSPGRFDDVPSDDTKLRFFGAGGEVAPKGLKKGVRVIVLL
jgi:hypothetical protein